MDPIVSAANGCHWIKAPDDVGAVRRLVRRVATVLGASDADCGRAELVTTELGTNLLRHARPPGYLLVQPLAPPHPPGIEIVAVDHGPGIGNLNAALHGECGRRDHGGADPAADPHLGCGLSSVRRLSAEFDAHTVVGQGTVVLARLFFGPRAEVPGIRWGAVSLPLAGEQENGDGWALSKQRDGFALMVADGLGHGPSAARASGRAVKLFREAVELDLSSFLRDAHAALRDTRGAAVSVCRAYLSADRLCCVGLGNVEGRVHRRGGSAGIGARPGTLGMNLQPPKASLHELAWEPGAMLILHSDGIRHHFDLSGLAGELGRRDPTLIAALIHRDFSRGRDDATVVVVRDTRGTP